MLEIIEITNNANIVLESLYYAGMSYGVIFRVGGIVCLGGY